MKICGAGSVVADKGRLARAAQAKFERRALANAGKRAAEPCLRAGHVDARRERVHAIERLRIAIEERDFVREHNRAVYDARNGIVPWCRDDLERTGLRC